MLHFNSFYIVVYGGPFSLFIVLSSNKNSLKFVMFTNIYIVPYHHSTPHLFKHLFPLVMKMYIDSIFAKSLFREPFF